MVAARSLWHSAAAVAEVLYYAIPFFLLLLALECLSFRHLGDDDDLGRR